MSCYAPTIAYYSTEVGESGKRQLTFDRKKSLTGMPLKLPCGGCVGCRTERARQWSVRMMHERAEHKFNAFVTLTYEDKNVPPGGTLVKRDLQLFFKRLRKSKHAGIRYFACGEYGDLNLRPHYHAILFNCRFEDAKPLNLMGENKYYESEQLRRAWGLGYVALGDVTYQSCNYVARYVMKKRTGKLAVDHYQVMDGDGQVFDREPEFSLMSNKPGIGANYYAKYGQELRDHDSIIIDGKEVPVPRYYDLKTEALDPEGFRRLKKNERRLRS